MEHYRRDTQNYYTKRPRSSSQQRENRSNRGRHDSVTIKSSRELKVYRKNPYAYKRAEVRKKKTVKALALLGVGIIAIVGTTHFIAKQIVNAVSISAGSSYSEDEDETIDKETIKGLVEGWQETNERILKSNLLIQKHVQETAEKQKQPTEEKLEPIFNVGNSEYISTVESFLNSEAGSYIYKYSECYGIDPNIMAAICMQETSLQHYECSPGGGRYNGYGVGLMQLESPCGAAISCYNYETKEEEVDYITMENACDLENNIKLGCMNFRKNLDKNMGNIILTIQSHNYGILMMDSIFNNKYKDEAQTTKQKYSNIDWIEDVKYAHNNPRKFVPDWGFPTYGDENYIENVLRYCPSKTANYKWDNKNFTIDLETLKVLNIEYISSMTR